MTNVIAINFVYLNSKFDVMRVKRCKTCEVTKVYTEFYKDKKNKDKLRTSCKDCIKKANQKYHIENKEEINKRVQEWAFKNFEKVAEIKTRWAKNNPNKVKDSAKKHKIENEEKINKRKKDYAKNNSNKVREAKRKYQDEKRLIINRRRRDKIKNDPLFRLQESIRVSIKQSLKRKGFKKKSLTSSILGCSYKEFLAYLNNNPYGFKYGDNKLDLDHIIPIKSATTQIKIIELNHYTNFQLLPCLYNRNIKKDNPWNPKHFKEWLKNQY